MILPNFPSSHLSLVRKDGALDLYHGVLRALILMVKKYCMMLIIRIITSILMKKSRSWSYMKFPYLKEIGKKNGWYTVGPLARMNTAEFIDTPLAQKEFEFFKQYNGGKPSNKPMHSHWARLIEILHSAEKIKQLLNDPDLMEGELVTRGNKQFEGVGLIEAPRGTLFHHYKIEENDMITMANLIVSTTNNNQPMNEAVKQVAIRVMTGQKEITEGMMNAVEVAIRAYDPCLSCATHALGQMPLEFEMYDADNNLIERKYKD